MNNLSQRIITSVILLFVLSISLLFNKYILLFGLILCSLVLFIEFNNLTKKIWKKNKSTLARANIFSLIFLVIFIWVMNFTKNPYYFNINLHLFWYGWIYSWKFNWWRKLTKISQKKLIKYRLIYFSLFPIVILWMYNNIFGKEADNYLKLIPVCFFV